MSSPNPYATPAAAGAALAPNPALGLLGACICSALGLGIFLLYLDFTAKFTTIAREMGFPTGHVFAFATTGGLVIAALPAGSPWVARLFRRRKRGGEIAVHVALLVAAIAMYIVLCATFFIELTNAVKTTT
jgi:hypothetical protein